MTVQIGARYGCGGGRNGDALGVPTRCHIRTARLTASRISERERAWFIAPADKADVDEHERPLIKHEG
jgi:hypothetical protein